MKTKTEIILQDISEYLMLSGLAISSNDEDGRINSVINEHEIITEISKKFKVSVPRSRCWADIFVNDEPVNIKTTNGNTADNASSKAGVNFSLTGKIHTTSKNWDDYLEFLADNLQESDTDYRYLIFNKQTSEVFYNSLKTVRYQTPNGSNLPFQINWGKNKVPSEIPYNEAKDRILTAFGKSIMLSERKVLAWRKHFPNYCD